MGAKTGVPIGLCMNLVVILQISVLHTPLEQPKPKQVPKNS